MPEISRKIKVADVHTPEQRHKNMVAIRSKDTKPEMAVRKFLFAKGLRYRLHDPKLPGKPDIIFPKYRTVVFIHGCFWHGHEECRYFKLPKTRTDFWKNKIEINKARDEKNTKMLEKLGWRILCVWECQLKQEAAVTLEKLFNNIIEVST